MIDFVQLAAPNKRHDEVDPVVAVEHELHAYEVRVVTLEQNLFFNYSVLNLIHFDKYVLPNWFDCVNFASRFQLAEVNFAKGAASQYK